MNALFKDDWLIHNDVPEDMIEQVTVGVDPSAGDDEVGIVASALLHDGRFAVLADRTTTGSPAQWGEAVAAGRGGRQNPQLSLSGSPDSGLGSDLPRMRSIAARILSVEVRTAAGSCWIICTA
jgi:hypothetical protein